MYSKSNHLSFSDLEDRIQCLQRSQALIHGHLTEIEKTVSDIRALAARLVEAEEERRRRRQYQWV